MRIDFFARLRPQVRVEMVAVDGVIKLKLIQESGGEDDYAFKDVMVELDQSEATLVTSFIDTYLNRG